MITTLKELKSKAMATNNIGLCKKIVMELILRVEHSIKDEQNA